MPGRRLAQHERRERVRPEVALDLLDVGLDHVQPARGDPRVVHEQVDRPEVVEHGGRHRRARVRIVDRRRVRRTAAPERLDVGDRRGRGAFVAAVIDRDVGTVGGQCERDGPSDPPPTAGDQRASSVQCTHVVVPS
jgi:hypothetical protein